MNGFLLVIIYWVAIDSSLIDKIMLEIHVILLWASNYDQLM